MNLSLRAYFSAIFICTNAHAYAMHNNMPSIQNPLKAQRVNMQYAWKLFAQVYQNPQADIVPLAPQIALGHKDMIHAVVAKLEELEYPTLPDNKKNLLNTAAHKFLHGYCSNPSQNQATVKQQLLDLNINPIEFHRTALDFFQLLGKHATA